jgi:tetratricopeptide (TPR) repeat protein
LNLGAAETAEYWFEKSIELGPGRFEARHAMMFLHLYRGDEAAAANEARKLLAEFPDSDSPLMLLRNHELKAGRYAEARNLYEKSHPDLLRDDPEVGRMNWGSALDLALVLLRTGETEQADLLLNRSLQYIQTQPHPNPIVDAVAAAQIFALQGKKQKALFALRQVLDEGNHRGWWYIFEHEPNLESLRGEPEFQAIWEALRADMAEQLARVREMEKNGELEPIPELAAE